MGAAVSFSGNNDSDFQNSLKGGSVLRSVSKEHIRPLGLSFFIAWSYLCFFTPVLNGPRTDYTPISIFLVFSLVAVTASLIVLSLTYENFLTRITERAQALIFAAITSFGTLVAIVSGSSSGALSSSLLIAAGLVTGCGSAWLFLLWGTYYSSHKTSDTIRGVSFSFCIAALFILLTQILPPPLAQGLTVFFPVVSVLVLFTNAARLSSGGKTKEIPSKEVFLVLRRFLLSVLAYGITLGYLRGSASMGLSFDPALSNKLFFASIALASLSFAAACLSGRFKFDMGLPYRVTLITMIAGIFGLPLLTGYWVTIADCAIGMSYVIFEICIWIIFSDYVGRSKVSALLVFGLVEAASHLGMLIGMGIGMSTTMMVSSIQIPISYTSFFVALILLIAAMVSFTKLDIFCARRSDETLSDSSKNYWLNPCDRAAEIYGLSAREREVLFLLVCGKLFSEIEQELFLSNSTVKTHARHIYEKLGVHGRHELQECILSQFKA